MNNPIFNKSLNIFDSEITLMLFPYKLQLRIPFGTSHSQTSFRTNALLLILIDGELTGMAEAGLPPKKKDCYQADIDDISEYVKTYFQTLQITKLCEVDVFDTQDYFLTARKGQIHYCQLHTQLLCALDQCSQQQSYSKAGKSLIESAVICSWAKKFDLPVVSLIGLKDSDPNHKSYYTASLNEDVNAMVQAAEFGHQYTPNLKIKLSDGQNNKQILEELDKTQSTSWSIDANCAWTPTFAVQMLEVLKQFKHKITMVEQPFPINFQVQDWIEVLKLYNQHDLLIFADESVRTYEDIPKLKDVVNGVNIKLEKCGGYRGALALTQQAQKFGLQTWFGCMVGSNLNSTATSHLFTLATFGSDLDGALLVDSDSMMFEHGFTYSQGSIKLPLEISGVGLVPKEELK